MVPGSNLLNMALTVIAKQSALYYEATDRRLNTVGQYVTTYATAITLYGSMQPVPRVLYQAYGLDFQKNYYNFYTSNNVIDIERDVSGDQVVFNNETFQCVSNDDWYVIDGWKGILLVMVESVASDTTIFGFGVNNDNFLNGTFIPPGDASYAG
jgi:hypothetical protein